MDYQKFNDAMQRIQKAQNDLNQALRDIFMAVSKEEMAPYYGGNEEDLELHVGDEVMTGDCFTGIVTHIGDKTVWIVYKIMARALGFDSRCECKDHCKKTGRHFDSIPFDYDPEKEKETI